MICTLVKGAMLLTAASHIEAIKLEPSQGHLLKQNHHRIAFIHETGAKPNAWPRKVEVVISGDIALILGDVRFTSADNLKECE